MLKKEETEKLSGGDKGIALEEGSFEYLKMEALELRQLLVLLTAKFKLSEDRRKVAEKRNQNLLKDNKLLQRQALRAEGKRILAEQEAGILQAKLTKLSESLASRNNSDIFLEELNEMLCKVNRATSCTGLEVEERLKVSELIKPKTHLSNRVENAESNTVTLSKQELSELDNDVKELKDVIQRREEAWSRTAERERCQRMRLNHMTVELKNLRNQYTSRCSDLELRSQEMKNKGAELIAARKEIATLKTTLAGRGQPTKREPKVKSGPKGTAPLGKPKSRGADSREKKKQSKGVSTNPDKMAEKNEEKHEEKKEKKKDVRKEQMGEEAKGTASVKFNDDTPS